jgi:hypothetical protein
LIQSEATYSQIGEFAEWNVPVEVTFLADASVLGRPLSVEAEALIENQRHTSEIHFRWHPRPRFIVEPPRVILSASARREQSSVVDSRQVTIQAVDGAPFTLIGVECPSSVVSACIQPQVSKTEGVVNVTYNMDKRVRDRLATYLRIKTDSTVQPTINVPVVLIVD